MLLQSKALPIVSVNAAIDDAQSIRNWTHQRFRYATSSAIAAQETEAVGKIITDAVGCAGDLHNLRSGQAHSEQISIGPQESERHVDRGLLSLSTARFAADLIMALG
jgi:hypothetical protein